MTQTLGETIKARRQSLDLSAQKAARSVSMSTAYLLKLEADLVKRPSPFTLERVARAVELPYEELLRLAGYLRPTAQPGRTLDPAMTALFADLTEDQLQHVAEYVEWYRTQGKRDEVAKVKRQKSTKARRG